VSRVGRVSWIGYPHLVIAEANSGAQLFYDEDDFQSYIQLLRQMVRDRMAKVHGFCLQKNEIRLVIKPLKFSLARIMQRLHCSHTLRINNRFGRRGHLFRGRFQSIVFSPEEAASVIRSVHLWPVRNGLVRRPEIYHWSSHGAYVTLGHPLADMLDSWDVLQRFDDNFTLAQRAFARYVESAALEEDNLGVTESSPGLTGKTEKIFTASMGIKPKRRLSLQSLSKRVALLLNIRTHQLSGASRRQDLVMARRLFATAAAILAEHSITDVAEFLQRDKAQVSRLVSQGIDLLDSNEAFKTLLETVRGRNLGPAGLSAKLQLES